VGIALLLASREEDGQRTSNAKRSFFRVKLGLPMPPPEIVEMEMQLMERAERARLK
jgi:hypothetical protein